MNSPRNREEIRWRGRERSGTLRLNVFVRCQYRNVLIWVGLMFGGVWISSRGPQRQRTRRVQEGSSRLHHSTKRKEARTNWHWRDCGRNEMYGYYSQFLTLHRTLQHRDEWRCELIVNIFAWVLLVLVGWLSIVCLRVSFGCMRVCLFVGVLWLPPLPVISNGLLFKLATDPEMPKRPGRYIYGGSVVVFPFLRWEDSHSSLFSSLIIKRY